MSSGLPILYLDSGGTGELVGEAGLPITESTFADVLDRVLAERAVWTSRARVRAVREYAMEAILPRYEHAIEGARRRRVPMRWRLLWRAAMGYPVRYAR
jgi:hypothetical protein